MTEEIGLEKQTMDFPFHVTNWSSTYNQLLPVVLYHGQDGGKEEGAELKALTMSFFCLER